MANNERTVSTRVSFDGEAQYKQAVRDINSNLRVLNSEMKLVTAEYRTNGASLDTLRNKQDILKRIYEEQKRKIEETEEALARCRRETGENSDASRSLEIQLNNQRTALTNTGGELDRVSEELEAFERAADEMGNEVEQTGEQAEDAQGKFSNMGEKIKTALSAMATVATATMAAAGAACR